MAAKSKSAKYYAENPEARKKKNEYQKKFNKKASQRKKRAELNAEARKRGIYGKRKAMGKDLAHTSDGKMVLKNSSANRGDKDDTAGDRRARGGKK